MGIIGIYCTPQTYAAECAGVQTSIISCTETGTVICKSDIVLDSDGNPVKDSNGNVKKADQKPLSNGMCRNGSSPEALGGDVKNSGAWGLLVMAIQIMTAGVGVLAVGGIVYGAVLYVSAADSAEQVKKARTIITNVIIGLIAYGLMYALLNYLIPGGLFS